MTNKNKNVLYVGVTNDLIRRIYEHKHHLDKESFTSKYNVTNLVYSIVFEGKNTPTSFNAVYVAASTTNNLVTDFHSDCIIYNRNSTDKYGAMFISLVCDSIDFGLGFVKGIAPPVGAGISTGIYYVKHCLKWWIFGY